ncbi:hypothetical protein JTE90_000299 [Oedothorax gibbosus]|uniref:Uncharacterized protein n=1 Tax=Oedothorax gibbosus TaxID=931172 RepID=A0AAV6VTP9_9ARAC|nr:hypothetical protein JTE90_000299 [Oedothorax gibbosus]
MASHSKNPQNERKGERKYNKGKNGVEEDRDATTPGNRDQRNKMGENHSSGHCSRKGPLSESPFPLKYDCLPISILAVMDTAAEDRPL